MGTLSRDLDAYQRALAIYQRRSGSYNNSIAKDPNGNPYLIAKGDYNPARAYGMQGGVPSSAIKVADSKSGTVSTAPSGVNFVGATDSGDPNYLLLRQNPRGTETKTFEGARYVNGQLGIQQGRSFTPFDQSKVRVVGQPDANGRVTVEYDVPTFGEKPRDFTMEAPDASAAAVRRDQRPSVVEQEGGLIGDLVASRGLKGSGDFPAQRGLINQARENRAATEKLEQEKLETERLRLEAEKAIKDAPVDSGGGN